MANTKILYAFVLLVVVIAIYFLIVLVGNQRGSEATERGLEQLTNVSICGLNTFNNECSRVSTDKTGSGCLWDQSGEPRKECILCESQVDGSTVYTCKLAVCGCGFGQNQVRVTEPA